MNVVISLISKRRKNVSGRARRRREVNVQAAMEHVLMNVVISSILETRKNVSGRARRRREVDVQAVAEGANSAKIKKMAMTRKSATKNVKQKRWLATNRARSQPRIWKMDRPKRKHASK